MTEGAEGPQTDLLRLLEAVERGSVSAPAAAEQLGSMPFRDLGFARVYTHRELRQGAPQAVLAEGKAPEEIEAIVGAMLDADAGSVLVTRADAEARAAVLRAAADAVEDPRARLAWVARGAPAPCGSVVVV